MGSREGWGGGVRGGVGERRSVAEEIREKRGRRGIKREGERRYETEEEERRERIKDVIREMREGRDEQEEAEREV